MITLSVSGLKGGAGKTVVATNLAAALHRSGHKTLLVDLDAQATASTWAARAAELSHDAPPVVTMTGPAVRRDIERVGSSYDVVVLDSPPRLGVESRTAVILADVVLLPVSPGVADTWALQSTLTVLEEARALRPELRAGLVLNRWDRSSLASSARSALEQTDLPVLGVLSSRVAYGEAMASGLGVIEYASKSEAALEFRRLVRATMASLGPNEAVAAVGGAS
jgi:chromosome partitioning protein